MTAAATRTNPFFAASTLPFGAPPFDQIREEDFQPAIEEGIEQHRAEIAAISADQNPPSFQNTVVALERSGELLNRVMPVFNAITGANTTDLLQRVQQEEAPRLAAHEDMVWLDRSLFRRIEAVFEQRDTLHLDPESRRLLEWYHDEFVRHGARLSETDKNALRVLNAEASTLQATFVTRLLAASRTASPVFRDRAALHGMSEDEIDAAARAAKERDLDGAWVIPLHNSTQQPALLPLVNRAVRRELFEASWNRTEMGDANDTRDIIARLAQVRAQTAQLLGYPSYAAWALQDQMARTPHGVLEFVRALVPAAVANVHEEGAAIQQMIESDGHEFQLEPWDWDHFAEKVRKAKYDIDEEEIRQYFDLYSVLENGVFFAATGLYGITFRQRHDIPVFSPDVRVYEVFDADGSSLALFYCDYFQRQNKLGGAWMDSLVPQSKLLHQKPVIYNVANYTKPAAGQPALISFDDVNTMFHEFGHALHGLFADQQYPSLSGTSVARDFVELPSQFNEHWAMDPAVFANYAKHCVTGEPMPQTLVDRIRQAEKFNQGYRLTEVLAAALLDMSWHSLPADAPVQNVDAFEKQSLEENHVDLRAVPPRYRSSYFLHIWANGYSAGYYAYLWAEMLDADAYEWFRENGGLTRANGDRFRAMILSRGNTEDLATMYRNFRGRDPRIEPMLEGRGLRAALVQ